MKILVLNCGSSSLKYQLIDMDNESVLAKGLCERIGIDGSKLTHKPTGKDEYVVEKPMKDHQVAVELVMDALQDAEHGVIQSTDEISAIGHRVLHGGTVYSDSIVVNDDVKRVIREFFDLGPLHNPANLIGIELARRLCQERRMWLYLTRPLVCPCQRKLICTQFLQSTMRSIPSADTVSTEPAINLCLVRRLNSAGWTQRMRRLSCAIWEMGQVSLLPSAENVWIPAWA